MKGEFRFLLEKTANFSFHRIATGKASFGRYSQNALHQLRDLFEAADLDEAWADRQAAVRQSTRS